MSMATKKQQHIYFLYDTNEYIYEWMTPFYDPDEYDHRRFTILDIPKRKRRD